MIIIMNRFETEWAQDTVQNTGKFSHVMDSNHFDLMIKVRIATKVGGKVKQDIFSGISYKSFVAHR